MRVPEAGAALSRVGVAQMNSWVSFHFRFLKRRCFVFVLRVSIPEIFLKFPLTLILGHIFKTSLVCVYVTGPTLGKGN